VEIMTQPTEIKSRNIKEEESLIIIRKTRKLAVEIMTNGLMTRKRN